jgi:hypothetical protein
MDDRHNLTATDEAINRKLEQLLAVELSPEFLARVRISVADAPVAGRSLKFSPLLTALAAVTAFIIASGLWYVQGDNVGRVLPSDPVAISQATGSIEPASTPEPLAPIKRPMTTKTARPMPRGPEVMVSLEDVKAFQQLVDVASARRFEVSPDGLPPDSHQQALLDIVVPEIVIAPITSFVPDEGVIQ